MSEATVEEPKTTYPEASHKLSGKTFKKRKLFNVKEKPKEEENLKEPKPVPKEEKKEESQGEVTKIPVAPEDLPGTPFVQDTPDRPTVIPSFSGQVGPIEAGVATVARELAPQLGSDKRHLSKMIIDERKLAVLNDFTQVSVGYFLYRGQVDKIRFWNYTANWELVSSQAIDGKARTHMLSAIAYAASGKPQQVAKKPNLLARHTYARNWKADAAREGKAVVEE